MMPGDGRRQEPLDCRSGMAVVLSPGTGEIVTTRPPRDGARSAPAIRSCARPPPPGRDVGLEPADRTASGRKGPLLFESRTLGNKWPRRSLFEPLCQDL